MFELQEHRSDAVADVGVQEEAAFPDVDGGIVHRLADVSLPDVGEFEKIVAVDRAVNKAWMPGVSDSVSCGEIILFTERLPPALIKLVINDPELLRDQGTVCLSAFEGCFSRGVQVLNSWISSSGSYMDLLPPGSGIIIISGHAQRCP